jgi:hypothetical protein
METINSIVLNDKEKYPDEAVLSLVLKESFNAYKKLLELFDENNLSYEWIYYKDVKAWLCKVQKKKRTIVWMSAWDSFIQSTIYFPEKYIDKVFELNINDIIKEKFTSTKNVGKSKPCIFEIKDEKILMDF